MPVLKPEKLIYVIVRYFKDGYRENDRFVVTTKAEMETETSQALKRGDIIRVYSFKRQERVRELRPVTSTVVQPKVSVTRLPPSRRRKL